MSGSNNFHDFLENTPTTTTTEYGHGSFQPTPDFQRDSRGLPAVYGGGYPHAPLTYDPGAAAFAPPVATMYAGPRYAGIDVLDGDPVQGPAGTEISISLRTRHQFPPHIVAFLSIDGIRSEARIIHTDVSEGFQYFVVKALAPRTSRTAAGDRVQVPLQVQVEDPHGQVIAVADAGAFAYVPPLQASRGRAPSQEGSRKRRVSSESRLSHGPVKKISSQQLQAKAQEQLQRASSNFGSESATDSLAPSPAPPSASSSGFSNQMFPLRGAIAVPHRASADDLSASISSVHSSAGQPSPTPAPANNPRPDLAPGAGSSSTNAYPTSQDHAASTRSSANPPLVRTSTVSHSAPRAHQNSPIAPESFNPYTIYAENKALLEIKGNLDSMAQDWTEEEKRSQRRLVEFSREQEGNHVTTTFKPVTLEGRAPNSICVSCIWWPEKEEAYVTSVDTIQLLESLVAVRFTVEEKNRIRRNLEGFRPKTVAKGKPDSERFFKTIMDFPSPKPRNIEKDVKVFPWKVLKHALKKIVGKYSASYASTQALIPQASPSGSAGAGYDQSPVQEAVPGAPPGMRAHPPPLPPPAPYARAYEADARSMMPPGSQPFPTYAMAPPPMQPHQAQHPAMQYGPIPPHQSVQYLPAGYDDVPEQQWQRAPLGENGARGGSMLRPEQHAQQIPDMRHGPYGAYAEHGVDMLGQQAGRHGQPYPHQYQAQMPPASAQTHGQHMMPGPSFQIPDNRFHQYGPYSSQAPPQ